MARQIKRLRAAKTSAGEPYAYAVYEVIDRGERIAIIQHDGQEWTLRPEENSPRVLASAKRLERLKPLAMEMGVAFALVEVGGVEIEPIEEAPAEEEDPRKSGSYELIFRLRQMRYLTNSLRAQCQGAWSGLLLTQGTLQTGERVKEAAAAFARARDQIGLALRELGDEPLEGDPE